MMSGLKRDEARVGDVVTPVSPLSQGGGEPRFQPGDVLTVKRAGQGLVLTVEDEAGRSGVWVCDCFRFLTDKPREQLLGEALEDLLSALSPLTVMGRSIASLDTRLSRAITQAVVLIGEPTATPADAVEGEGS